MGGSLTEQEIIEVKNNSKNIKKFVETGTYKADTTILASKHFDNIYTTEISNSLYNESKNRAEKENITNIKFLNGDSINLLKEIMEDCKEDLSFVFFIDAHISGYDSDWNKTNRVPLLEELDVILNYKVKNSVFIFDDVRFWKNKENEAWDWSHISPTIILKRFLDKGINILEFYEKNDRFFVYIE